MSQILRRKSFRWLTFVVFGMVLFCCGVPTTMFYFSKNMARRSLEDKLEQLAAKGIPVDDASITEFHHNLSSTENADKWISIIDRLSSKSFSEQSTNLPIVGNNQNPIPKHNEPWADQAAVEQLMSQYADTMKQLIELAQDNGPVRYPIQFQSYNTLLPYTQNTRTAARMLLLEATLAARSGDADREFRAINAMIGCSLSLRGEPSLISQLVVIATHGMAIKCLQSAVIDNRLSAEQLATLRARLVPYSDIKHAYSVGLKGELGAAIPAFNNPSILLSPQMTQLGKFMVESGFTDRAARDYAIRIEEALEIPTDNLQQFIADCEAWESQFANGGMMDQMQNSLMRQVSPSLSALAAALVRNKMMNDLATLAIATRQYEFASGKLPKQLEDLQSQGIDLKQFQCVDGSLPLYLLADNTTAPASSDGKASRAILWSFNPQVTTQNPKPALKPTPPDKFTIDPSRGETELNWWRWDFE